MICCVTRYGSRMEVEPRPTASGVAVGKPKRKRSTLASVFIIESVSFVDEEESRLEGDILSQILQLSGKRSEHYYIRTKKELEAVLGKFGASGMRYLHISCHGNSDSLFTTLDHLPFDELGPLLVPYLKERRLFVSACEAVNRDLAEAVMPDSGCYSIIGPARDIAFGDAAVMWAAFYHLIFKQNAKVMKGADIRHILERLIETFSTPMTYIQRTTAPPHWREVTLRN